MGPRGSVWLHIQPIRHENRIRKRLQPLRTPKTPLKNSKIKKIKKNTNSYISLFGVSRWGHSKQPPQIALIINLKPQHIDSGSLYGWGWRLRRLGRIS